MENKKLARLLLSLSFLVIGTMASLYISTYLHIILSGGEIRLLGLLEVIRLVIKLKQVRIMLLLLEGGTILLSIAFFLLNDSFYKSELVKVTPNIKIPKAAGQMQFGSARFLTDREKEEIFTLCKIDKDDKFIKRLLANAKKEEENERSEQSQKVLSLPEPLDTSKASNVIKETGEIINHKYEYQERVSKLFKNNPKRLSYFMKKIQDIDTILMEERAKKKTKLETMMGAVLNERINESVQNEFVKYKESVSSDLLKEINDIDEGEGKKLLAHLYDNLRHEFESEVKTYVQKIKKKIDSISKVNEKTDLNQYYEIAENIKLLIQTLPDAEGEVCLVELSSVYMDIYEESDRRMKEIEEILRGAEV